MNYFLNDSLVGLRHLVESDVYGPYADWFNNQDTNAHNSHGRFPKSPESLLTYLGAMESSHSDLLLGVFLLNGDLHVGNISLLRINWIDRNCEIAFMLGDPRHRGKSVMFHAGSLLINHAFLTLNLHRVSCGTLSSNVAMQKLANKLNMTQEGLRRDYLFKSGVYYDMIEYGLLRSDWLK